jgi:hypothetical protein
LGTLLGHYVDLKDKAAVDRLVTVLRAEIAGGLTSVVPVAVAAEQSGHLFSDTETHTSNRAVEALYNVSSIGPVNTDPVALLREQSLQLSQQHY